MRWRSSKARRWWRWGKVTVLAGAGLLLIALIAGWLMFQRIPDWYHPAALPPERFQAVRDDFVRTGDYLSERMATASGPFELRITQDQLNAWLTAREEMWPLSREWLPRELSDPYIRIEPSGLRLAGTLHWAGLRTVVSARLEVQSTASHLHVRLMDLSGGALPVPEGWVQELLRKADAGRGYADRQLRHAARGESLPPLDHLLEGIDLPNTWIWPEPRRIYRIDNIELRDGELVATIQPRASR